MRRQVTASPRRKKSLVRDERPKLIIEVGGEDFTHRKDLDISSLSTHSKTTTAASRYKSLSRQFPKLKSITPKGTLKRPPGQMDRSKIVTGTPKGTLKPSVFDFSGTPKQSLVVQRGFSVTGQTINRVVLRKMRKQSWMQPTPKEKRRNVSTRVAELGKLEPPPPKRFNSPRKTVENVLRAETTTREAMKGSGLRQSATEGPGEHSHEESSLLTSIVTQVKETQETVEDVYKDHLYSTFNALRFIKSMTKPTAEQIYSKRVNLPKKGGTNRKTLIFDLDETLVHCCEEDLLPNADIVLPVKLPSGDVINVSAK
jgi:hypothetical protein